MWRFGHTAVIGWIQESQTPGRTAKSCSDLCETTAEGLTQKEAEERLRSTGPNEVAAAELASAGEVGTKTGQERRSGLGANIASEQPVNHHP